MNRRALLKGLAVSPFIAYNETGSTKSPFGSMHVAVIGSGAFGCWTALNLVEQGVQVTLIDPWGPGNSRSSSGGESRLIRSVYGANPIYTQWVQRSFELWLKLQKQAGQRIYFPTGLLWMFSGDDELMQESLPVVEKAGYRIDTLPMNHAEKQFPHINFSDVKSVYYEHSAGYLLSRVACQIIEDRVCKLGGRVIREAALPIHQLSGGLDKITLADGASLYADHFVFACGPWLGQLLPDLLQPIIIPTRQDVLFFGLPEHSEYTQSMPSWVNIGDRIFYGMANPENRGFKVADHSAGDVINPTTVDRTVDIASLKRASEFLSHRFPDLDGAPLVESRVCQYENSPDTHLVIDQYPDADNAWVVGGGSGQGFKISPAVGEYVCSRILERVDHEPLFGISRFL
ncbi:FAD-dependent oxidoreductase [Endozoicomonas elysicola]|uniref:FAD dependent oxidoreductase domain-containing protein n=1 Tax=Endozoicomonas elysicola TaxID=305900 RepID=A0A081K692_9GAMM|nr:FAD-dependent oxidoreductase [Endozoicomonas elysicola]KEI69668.1 hypothetical protein GV64_01945 [Endozoicomonas elysicola]